MSKLDINSLLTASLKSKGESIEEGASKFNIDLEKGEGEGECEGCGTNKFNLNLESVAFEERAQEFLGESTLSNIRAAIASGMAVAAVLEARNEARLEAAE